MNTSNQLAIHGKTGQAILRSTEYNGHIWQPEIYNDLLTDTYNELRITLEGNIDNEISNSVWAVRVGGFL